MKRYFVIIVLVLGSLTGIVAQNSHEMEVMTKLSHAFLLNKDHQYEEALKVFLEVGKETESQKTKNEKEWYVMSQLSAAQIYDEIKKYDEGFALARKLLQLDLTDEQRNDAQFIFVMNGYSMAYNKGFVSADHEYENARNIFNEILPYADEKMKGRIMDKIANCWHFESTLHEMRQQYDLALKCMVGASHVFHHIGKKKEETEALCKIGSLYESLLNFEAADSTYQEAEKLSETLGNQVQMMVILRDLRRISQTLGNMTSDRKYENMIDSLMESSSNEKVKFDYFCNKADIAISQQDYGLAQEWLSKNEDYIAQLPVNVLNDRYTYHCYLRSLYTASKQYDKALVCAKLCIREFQTKIDRSMANSNLPYSSIAYIYRLMGDSVHCKRYIDSLFMNISELKDPKEIYYLYTSRMQYYFAFKHYEAALADCMTADSILSAKYDEKDGGRLTLLAMNGGIQANLGNYTEAEKKYRRYAELMREIYGENNMEYINSITYLANAEGFAGHIDEGCADYSLAVDKMKKLTKKRLPYFTEAERNSYWEPVSALFAQMTPYALKAEQYQTAFTQSCYNALVMSKAFLLESERSSYDVIKRHGSKEDMQDYLMTIALHTKIKKWKNHSNQYADSILKTTLLSDRIEKKLTDHCRAFGDITSFINTDYHSVKQMLDEKDVLIDFTDFMTESGKRKYAAYIIKKNQQYPLLQALFTEHEIDSLQMTRPDMYYDKEHAQDIIRLLWLPLKAQVQEGATVYYVPSQLLFTMALESLPLEDGSLLGDHYKFVRLSSAREIVNAKRGLALPVVAPRAVLYGGLRYDLDATTMANESKAYDLNPLLAMRGDIVRGDSIFRELPGTKKEIDAIAHTLSNTKFQVCPYSGEKGTEESFISLNGHAPAILHLATHGFFYTPNTAQEVDFLKGYTDAMSLSGIVLAGGNAAWLGKKLPKGVLGGIITASNISRLDLSGTDMVVLSACKTAQGKATSEGLYGLQRAFKKAGVQTLVMALWNISDHVTREFMEKFYERLIEKSNKWNKRKAFEETKAFIRSKYPEPYYWASFIMLD